MEFTDKELTIVADIIVGRYEALKELHTSHQTPKQTKADITVILSELQSVTDKLRPYYTGEE